MAKKPPKSRSRSKTRRRTTQRRPAKGKAGRATVEKQPLGTTKVGGPLVLDDSEAE